jgi:L-alanine-DL-glutamate epimerase-like enolase superfamily enzyme
VTIAEVFTARYDVALREPFVTALRRVTGFTSLLVGVRDSDGMTGIGEAVATPPITGESLESIEAAIAGPLSSAVVGAPVEELDAVLARMSGSIVANTSAKAALDIALHDLWSRSLGAPLHRLLGGSRRELVTDVTISMAAPAEMAAAARARVADGFSALKLKLGGPSDLDFERVLRIREAVGAGVTIRVDANQGWNAKQAVRLIRRIEDADLGIELVEQPVPAGDLEGLAHVTASVTTPVMADESCFSPHDVIELVRRHAVDAVNVKLMKCGGIRPAKAVLSVADAAGLACSVGSMMEGTVSATAAACLAAGLVEVSTVDLDAPWWTVGQTVDGGAVWEGERILLSEEPGLGHRVPDELFRSGVSAFPAGGGSSAAAL